MKSAKIIDSFGNVYETEIGQVSHLMNKIEQSLKFRNAEIISENESIVFLQDGTKINFNSEKKEIFFDIHNFGLSQVFCLLNDEECQHIKNLMEKKV